MNGDEVVAVIFFHRKGLVRDINPFDMAKTVSEYQMQALILVLGKYEDCLQSCGKATITAVRNGFNIRQDFISHTIFQRGCWGQAKTPRDVEV